MIFVEYLEGQRTITGSDYIGVLTELKQTLMKKRLGKLHRGVLFNHDNAPGHSSKVVKTVLREFRLEIFPHPPYSPDYAPADFFLFPKLKEHLKRVRCRSIDEANTTDSE